MLTIKPYEDKATIIQYCKKCKRLYSDGLYLYLAKDGSQQLAAALFEIGGEHVEVVFYETTDQEDFALFDTMLRAGLNYANEHGISLGHIPEEFRQTHKTLFDKINFPIHPTFNINNFFQKYKNCARMF